METSTEAAAASPQDPISPASPTAAPDAFTLPQPMAPGIYFGLDAEVYHRDPSLGSHDVVRLFQGASYYWWDSWMNPLREMKNQSHLDWGSAFHCLILEGEDAFHKHYGRIPDISEYPDALDTADQIKARLKALGLPVSGRKDELIRRLLEADPAAVIWDHVLEKAAGGGRRLLKSDVYADVVLSAKMITANPNIARAFTQGYAEVSIFWTEQVGDVIVPCKCRIDFLRLLETVDLKSIANQRNRSFRNAVRYAIADYRYDIQSAHYQTGREAARRYVREGKVFGPPPAIPPQKWLELFAKVRSQADAPDTKSAYTWIWVFYQKGPPIAQGFEFNPRDGAFDVALTHRQAALDTYAAAIAKFGTGMWIVDEPISLIQGSDLPASMGA